MCSNVVELARISFVLDSLRMEDAKNESLFPRLTYCVINRGESPREQGK